MAFGDPFDQQKQVGGDVKTGAAFRNAANPFGPQETVGANKQGTGFADMINGPKAPAPSGPSTVMPVGTPKQLTPEQLQQQQVDYAKKFRENLGGMEEQAFRPQRESAVTSLAQQQQNIRAGASNRGLLYSGLRQQDEANAGANTEANLQNKRADINNSFKQSANAFDQQALSSGMQIQQNAQDIQDQLYNQALNQYQQKNGSLLGSLAGGGIIGSALSSIGL